MIINRIRFFKKCVLLSDILITSWMLPLATGFFYYFSSTDTVIINNFFFTDYIDWNIFHYSSILICLLPVWYFTLHNFRAYHFFRIEFINDILYSIIASSMTMSLIMIAFFLFFPNQLHYIEYIHKGLIIDYRIGFIYPLICAFFLSCSRIFLVVIFRITQRLGYNQRQIIIIGTGPRAVEHCKKIINNPQWGFHIQGFVTLNKEDLIPKELSKFPVIGSLDEIDTVINKYHSDEIFFIVPRQWLDKIESAVMICDLQGINVHIAVDLFSIKISKSTISTYYKLPVLSLNAESINYPAISVKRLIDIIFSFLGIIIFFPIACIIALAIKIESKGSVFYIQIRSGKHGREFPMLKFRTMIENAEKLLKNLKFLNEQDGPVFKMKHDPRVTKIGKFLRKSSLDEMPQLINVLLGQMSLVGPRPPIPAEVDLYEPWQRRRLSMRPGITCIWQVSGRNDVSFERWMEMDLEYIDNWSLLLDLKLLLKTIPYVLIAKGNH